MSVLEKWFNDERRVCICGHIKGAHYFRPESTHPCLVAHCECKVFIPQENAHVVPPVTDKDVLTRLGVIH